MNQILRNDGMESAMSPEELKKTLVDMLLANTNVPVLTQIPQRSTPQIGRGKLTWQGPERKWILSYDTSKLGEEGYDLLELIKEFYAYFVATEFYPEYQDHLVNGFLDSIDDEDKKIRFARIMLADLEDSDDEHIGDVNKIETKKKLIEAYTEFVEQHEYWNDGDTLELEITVTDLRDSLCDTLDFPVFDEAG